MFELPEALAPMAAYKQWMLWKWHFVEDRQGWTKVPINPHTQAMCSAHLSSHWVTGPEALQLCKRIQNVGTAFVFTEQDPFFFLDIDKCVVNGAWSPVAQELMTMLAGCAVEVSASGQGLHVFGTGAPKLHGCRNKEFGIELYTSKRFCAVTGTNIIGNALTNASVSMNQIVNKYFPPGSDEDGPGEANWIDEADPQWAGPDDDDDLLRRALASRSVSSMMGTKASFDDLFQARVEVLQECYPDPRRAYDASAVDQALASHLAFWTGRNTARMKRLMLRSNLVRDKWSSHKDYLWRTISNACTGEGSVYRDPRADNDQTLRQSVTAVSDDVSLKITLRDDGAGTGYMPVAAQAEHFKGCVYIRDMHRIWTPDGHFLKPDQFRASYGGYVFAMDVTNEKDSRNAWEVFTESRALMFPKADSTAFEPRNPERLIQREGFTYLNTYLPIETARAQGDPSPFLDHVALLFPDEEDRNIILGYMAACIQHKGKKIYWAPVIQGCEGNGKSLLGNVIEFAIGSRYSHRPQADDIGNNFNAWAFRKLFVAVEEVKVGDKFSLIDTLKPMITNERIPYTPKGVDQFTAENYANWMMFTNHKNAIPMRVDSRRYAIFYTPQQVKSDLSRDGMEGDYFPKLYEWLRHESGYEIVNNWLQTYDIPDKYNPHVELHRAPKTTSTDEALQMSHTRLQELVIEAVEAQDQGFRGGWICVPYVAQLAKDNNVRTYGPRAIANTLEELGYIPHPYLPAGRTNTPIPIPSGKLLRAVLYVKEAHLVAMNVREPKAIVSLFLEANGFQHASVSPITGGVGRGEN